MPTPIAAMAAMISAKTNTAWVMASVSRASRLSKNQRFHWLSATVAAVDRIRQVASVSVSSQAPVLVLPCQKPPAKRANAPTTRRVKLEARRIRGLEVLSGHGRSRVRLVLAKQLEALSPQLPLPYRA